MARYRYSPGLSYVFGPGPASTAVKALIWANVAMFVLRLLMPGLITYLGFSPAKLVEEYWFWQPVTYMFLHGDLLHILFNMLALWMFGVELERRWGTPFFLKYYFVTGIGGAATTLILSFLPFSFAQNLYRPTTIGASGAVLGLLLAYALYYPNRPIYIYFLFPIPTRIFVMIVGAMAFYSSISQAPGGIAHAAHLGGLIFGYAYLKGRSGLVAEIKYRYVKGKMNRLRRKFGVHPGGRGSDWDRHIH